MLTILQIDLDGPPSSNNYWRGFVRKTLDLPFAPSIGMEIDDPAWKDSRKVQRVTLIIEERGGHVNRCVNVVRRRPPQPLV